MVLTVFMYSILNLLKIKLFRVNLTIKCAKLFIDKNQYVTDIRI